MELIDKAKIILLKSNHGKNLTPEQLKLVQATVDNDLRGYNPEAFEALYQDADSGKYLSPVPLGVEFLELSHDGFVLFKGKRVVQYDADYLIQSNLKELQQACLYLEQKSLSLDLINECFLMFDGKYAEDFGQQMKNKLDALVQNRSIRYSMIVTAQIGFFMPGYVCENDVKESADYMLIRKNLPYCSPSFEIAYYRYGSGEQQDEATLEELDYISACHQYLCFKHAVEYVSSPPFELADLSEDEEEFEL